MAVYDKTFQSDIPVVAKAVKQSRTSQAVLHLNSALRLLLVGVKGMSELNLNRSFLISALPKIFEKMEVDGAFAPHASIFPQVQGPSCSVLFFPRSQRGKKGQLHTLVLTAYFSLKLPSYGLRLTKGD